MADHSVQRDIAALLQHGLEQTKVFHEATTRGVLSVPPEKAIELAFELLSAQATAIQRLAAEIDEIRSRIENG